MAACPTLEMLHTQSNLAEELLSIFNKQNIFPDLSKNDVKCIAEEQKQQAYDMFDSGELSEEEIFRKSGKLLLWGWMKSIFMRD